MIRGPSSRPRLIILCGLSFAGKSTLADAISARHGYPQVDVDETKAALYGPGVGDEDLGAEAWARIYRETDERIRAHLRRGETVVDASRNFTRAERDQARALAAALGARVLLIYVNTPEALARRRWEENRETRRRRDVSARGFEEIIRAMEQPTADEAALEIDHRDNIASWLDAHKEVLSGKRPARPKRLGALLLALLLLATAAACARNRGPLERTQWRLLGWTQSPVNPRDFEFTAKFSAGRISGKSALNISVSSVTPPCLRVDLFPSPGRAARWPW